VSAQTTVEPFTTWDHFDRACSGLMAQMRGFAEGVNQNDDAQMLAWARTYLPWVLELSERRPS